MASSSSSSRSSSLADSVASGSSSPSRSSTPDSAADRLAALEAHGAAFLSSFGLDAKDLALPEKQEGRNKKRRRIEREEKERRAQEEQEHSEAEDEEEELSKVLAKAKKDTKKGKDAAATKSAVKVAPTKKGKARAVETIVFDGGASKGREEFAAASEGMKEFMSSKVKKPNQPAGTATATKRRRGGETGDSDSEGDDEKAAQANDKALSQLLSTTLFAPGTGQSVSSNRSKANLGHHDTLSQLLELSAPDSKRKGMAVGRGWGEAALKAEGMSKMPSAMRAGLRKAEKQSVEKEVERAKELGTYHPSLKKHLGKRAGHELIMGEGRKEEKERRGREKGLKASIGKFRDGTLTLSKREIEKVNSGGGSRSGRGGSRGGKRGGRR